MNPPQNERMSNDSEPSTPQNVGARPRILVTAGPTWEPIDQVRYLGNRSSGRMGLECAAAAVAAGCPTTLLRGPGTPCPHQQPGLCEERFESARELEEALTRLWPAHDILVMAAAVADFRPRLSATAPAKFRRSEAPPHLDLEAVPDLLAQLAELDSPGQIRIGFALEPASELAASAQRKLEQKRLRGIVANPLETLDSDSIDGYLLLADGSTRQPPSSSEGPISKARFAQWLLTELRGLIA